MQANKMSEISVPGKTIFDNSTNILHAMTILKVSEFIEIRQRKDWAHTHHQIRNLSLNLRKREVFGVDCPLQTITLSS